MSIRVTELFDHHRTPAVILLVALAFAVSGAVWRAASPATWATTRHTGLAATESGLDASFAAAMIAHHQGAIDMARAELRGGRNEQLRRLAQEIIVTQQQEIAVMRLAITAGAQVPVRGQAPGSSAAASVAVSHRDRVYAAEQFSNTVSVTDPVDNKLLGVIRLGDPQPTNLSPLYRGQVLVHGLGFSPDHTTLAVVAIGTNSVSFIETLTNVVKHTTYVGRAPHEAFFTPDGSEVWVTVRGEYYVAVLDAHTFVEKTRIKVPIGPGMQIFSRDGRYGYVCSSFTPTTVIISVRDHRIIGRITQDSPFCPNIAATPDGNQVWLTLKDIGRVMVFDARPPFSVLKRIDTGPLTNHVNFANTDNGIFAYVTVGGLNEVQVYRTRDFAKVATIATGLLPHGVWPSGDGSRVYVGLENADALTAINTQTNHVIATVAVGQAPQAIAYVPNAVPNGDGMRGLQQLGIGGQSAQLHLFPVAANDSIHGARAPTSVTLFDQGLTQVLQASVTGLAPRQAFVLALSADPSGSGPLEPLADFNTNAAGAAIVNAVGPIRQIVRDSAAAGRRFLVIASETSGKIGVLAQIQAP